MKGIIPGQIISHYRITEKLGAGGMGEIYKAEDIKLKRTVALKFLPSSFSSDSESKKRLIHEAQAASSLDHPNICNIYEIGETDDELLFISMALYEGETLKDKIAKGPIAIDEAIKITLQICEGLEKAHKNDIIHRDIKPANIFITNDGIVKILDFGLAKSKGQTQLTQMGSTVGTVDYMSPEQATGSIVDKKTDIWSLGVVFYEMLTGQRPFAAEYEQAVIYSILNTEPDLSKVSKELATIISGAVNKSLEQRYQNAEEMRIDLESLRDGTKTKRNYIRIRLSKISLRTKIIAAVVVMIGLAAIVYINMTKSAGTTTATPERKMIVVLPFENLGSPDDEYFAQAMREEISNKLAALGSIGVISRSSAEKFANTKKTAKEMGKELGVDYILEGTVQWAKNKDKSSRIRIIPQLIRVSDDVNVWSDSYDRVIDDIFNIQNEIARNVVDNLGLKLLPDQTITGPPLTRNLDAYDYYMKAVKFHYGPSTGADIKTCIKLYEQAIQLDRSFASAYAQLSIAYNALFKWYWDRDSLNLKKASAYLQKAKELDPDIAIVHLSQFFYYAWFTNDAGRAFEELKKTIEIDPNNAEALGQISGFYAGEGKTELAKECSEKSIKLDPLNARTFWNMGSEEYYSREYKNAEKNLKHAIELSPNVTGLFADLAQNYLNWKGSTKLARQTIQNIKDDEYLEGTYNFFIYLNILDRNFNEALKQLTNSTTQFENSYSNYIPNYYMIGLIYKYMGERELSKKYFDSSKVHLVKMLKMKPGDNRLHFALSRSYAAVGEFKKALDQLNKGINSLELYDGNPSIVRSNHLAIIYILSSDNENALKQIDYLLSKPSGFSVNILKLDPLYDPLRNLPGYKNIINKYSNQMD
jgi:serine/threonine protein kinase/Flp pilus assembly protein TadD